MDENFRDLDEDMTLDRVLSNGDSSNENATIMGNVALGDVTANSLSLVNAISKPAYVVKKTGSFAFNHNTQIVIEWGNGQGTNIELDTDSGHISVFADSNQPGGFASQPGNTYQCKSTGWYQVDCSIVVDDNEGDAGTSTTLIMGMSERTTHTTASPYGLDTATPVLTTGSKFVDASTISASIHGLAYLTAGRYYSIEMFYKSSNASDGALLLSSNKIDGAVSNGLGQAQVSSRITRWSLHKVFD
jgi:hypothetical protein